MCASVPQAQGLVRRCAQSQRPPAPPTQAVTRCGVALVPRCSFPAPRAVLPSAPRGSPMFRRLRRMAKATQPQPRSASGASHRPGSHRMTERISSSAVKGALRFATPLRALDGTGAGCARRKNAAKKKTNRNQTAPATRARIIRVWPRRSGSKKPRRGIFYGRESASGGSALREAAPRLGLRRFGGELGVGST